MGSMCRAFVEAVPWSSSAWVEALDISVAAPDRGALRLALQAAVAATGLWQGSIYAVTRLYVTPTVHLGPLDLAVREQAAGLLHQAIASEVDDARTARLLDWVFGPWLSTQRMFLRPDAWDRPRTLDLERLRTPMLAPWLAGARPVHDLDAFRGFHLGLSPEERFAARLIAYWASHGSGMSAYTNDWFGAAAASLEAGEWVEISTNMDGRPIFLPGRILRRLAVGQGELLEA